MIDRFKRYTVLVALAVLVGAGLWLHIRVRSGTASPVLVTGAGAVLPKEDREQIIVDPRRHMIIIKREGGDTVTHLPDRPSVIDIRKDGTVKVTAPQFGLECRPFVGLGYSDDVRIGLGLDGAYWKAFYLGGGIAATLRGASPRLFVAVSYNVKDNLRISLTLDHAKQPGLMLSLRV